MVDVSSRVGSGVFVGRGGDGLSSPSNPNGSVQREWKIPGKNETRSRKQSKKVVVVDVDGV